MLTGDDSSETSERSLHASDPSQLCSSVDLALPTGLPMGCITEVEALFDRVAQPTAQQPPTSGAIEEKSIFGCGIEHPPRTSEKFSLPAELTLIEVTTPTCFMKGCQFTHHRINALNRHLGYVHIFALSNSLISQNVDCRGGQTG